MSTRSFWTGGAITIGGVAGGGSAIWIGATAAAIALVAALGVAEAGTFAGFRRRWRARRA